MTWLHELQEFWAKVREVIVRRLERWRKNPKVLKNRHH